MRPIAHLMFRLIIVLIAPAISVSGCMSDQEIQTEKNKAFITQTKNADWGKKIPLDDMVTSVQLCKSGSYKTECDDVAYQLYDISASYSSCQNSPNSKLCHAIIQLIQRHQILTILPATTPILLPQDPFYKKMPTGMLDALSWSYGYRLETIGWWLSTREFQIKITAACIALLMLFYISWVWWDDTKTKKENEAKVANQRQVQRKHALQLQAEQKRLQAERLEMQVHFKNDTHEFTEVKPKIIDAQAEAHAEKISELQAKRQAELITKQTRAAAEAKLKAEQAETMEILEIAFPRKHVSKPRKLGAGSV